MSIAVKLSSVTRYSLSLSIEFKYLNMVLKKLSFASLSSYSLFIHDWNVSLFFLGERILWITRLALGLRMDSNQFIY